MDTTTTANIVAFFGTVFTLLGVSGVTSADVSGFVNVIVGLITLASILVGHIAHKNAVAA